MLKCYSIIQLSQTYPELSYRWTVKFGLWSQGSFNVIINHQSPMIFTASNKHPVTIQEKINQRYNNQIHNNYQCCFPWLFCLETTSFFKTFHFNGNKAKSKHWYRQRLFYGKGRLVFCQCYKFNRSVGNLSITARLQFVILTEIYK